MCGTVLKCHDMFWSSVDYRTSKEQSLMSLFGKLQRQLITPYLLTYLTHISFWSFYTNYTVTYISQIDFWCMLHHCVDLNERQMKRFGCEWDIDSEKGYILVCLNPFVTHLAVAAEIGMKKKLNYIKYMLIRSKTEMVDEPCPLFCQIFLSIDVILLCWFGSYCTERKVWYY